MSHETRERELGPVTFTAERLNQMTPNECAQMAAAFMAYGAWKLKQQPKPELPPEPCPTCRRPRIPAKAQLEKPVATRVSGDQRP